MRKYLLQIIERNINNPLQAGPVHSVEGDSLIEICSKIPLLIKDIQRFEEQRFEEKRKSQDYNTHVNDDIPF